MSGRSVLLAATSAALALALAPARVHAWTDASVTRVAADVDVPRDGLATVSLAVTVHVRGGWLEQIELAGLDPGLALVDPPPLALDAEGVTHVPTAHVEPDGRVLLAFVRDDAPRRGDVLVSLAYRAHVTAELDPEREPARVRWTLPPWESGLDGASLTLHVPGRATVPDEIACPSCEVATSFDGARTTLTLHRTHLPRATTWDAALDVPRDALALPALVRPPPLVPRRGAVAASWPTLLALALVLAFLGVAKRAAFRRALVRRGARVAAWSVLRALVFVGAASAATTAAVLLASPLGPLGAAAGLAAVVALALRGTPPGRGWPQLGSVTPVTRRDLRRAAVAPRETWLSPAALLDATTPLGVLTLLLLAGAAHFLAPHAAPALVPLARALPLFAAPLWLTSTRFQLPPTAHDQLRLLRTIAAQLALPSDVALSLVLHHPARRAELGSDPLAHEPQEARLRLELAAPPDGLVRLDVAIAVGRGAGGFALRPVCLAIVSAAGPLQRAIADARLGTDAALAPGGRRIAHVLPLDALPRLLAVLSPSEGRDESAGTAQGAGAAPVLPVRRMSAERARGARCDDVPSAAPPSMLS